MTSKMLVAGMLIVGLCQVALAVPATPFDKQPEVVWTPIWQTSAPYQRDIYWDFASDPQGGPSPSGTPGTVYSGTHDTFLRESDFVTFSGAMTWFDDTGISGGPTGLIGVDNRGGSGILTGSVTFHLDNLDNSNPVKHVWLEMEWGGDLTPFYSITTDADPLGSVVEDDFLPASLGWTSPLLGQIDNKGFTMMPNPEWEELTISFIADPNELLIIDSLHIATECIPEPATLALLGVGGVLLMIRRRK